MLTNHVSQVLHVRPAITLARCQAAWQALNALGALAILIQTRVAFCRSKTLVRLERSKVSITESKHNEGLLKEPREATHCDSATVLRFAELRVCPCDHKPCPRTLSTATHNSKKIQQHGSSTAYTCIFFHECSLRWAPDPLSVKRSHVYETQPTSNRQSAVLEGDSSAGRDLCSTTSATDTPQDL